MELTLIITGGVLLGCLIGLSWFAGSDAPFVPTKQEKIKKALSLIPLKNKTFYELGSGDGRVVIEAAKMGSNAFGIEQSWIRILYSRWKAYRQNLPNAKFIHGDIFKQNLSNADLVFIFLLPKGVEKLEPKLKRQLKKEAVVITQTFHFKNWKPYKKILISDKQESNALLGLNKVEGDFWLYRK
ncbi:hypothetical protein A3B42_03360 [Candidatus Daviesbacteria bacterium RIFCSPLOWO2_01_FULL_38_10]|nr:MAG: hypothetical protein A3D02_01165 [Candidatus Daviesbacteria bacterium RIFCSPHIGHO2_02_FULL_39_41]OGE37059.1 MAG: hypothetical protein A3B42_03360 [Candidatus Daviesbacteria bacterium RIFCSPLOWO2_01_FULL_38_10]OGE43970.1 MAG: hypothetical protein A3E67_00775 [Candidatus Daviesbacteria bacterium RIFCSPHIGHO2_12_FULL_38_25]OGE67167.1 MAG: hypothetical protein A3H81_04865 [Candidatus Daviesbacteria bacterium RIFCSPLOWO2_02_FULL_38_18]OGE73492.1 MAG: hypothetical protein A3H18_03315 [Candida